MEMPTPRSIQRTYLLLMLGNTLAASFIWGINTIFLLDAGLTNLEAFAANAFFSAGMVLFEVPTGIVADTIGRRMSYLLGTLTLTASTLLYVLLWQIEAPFWSWAIASMLLGLGFTFFSGAVEAWLIDALEATGFQGEVEAVFGRGQIVTGAGMLSGSVAGGFIAAQTSLGVPFVLRAVVLAVMFVVAFRMMHDVGFTPVKGGRPLAEMRKIASASIEYGWRQPAVKWLMVESLFTGGVGIYGFYALQPYLLELYGDPDAYQIAGLSAAIVAGAQILGGWSAPRIRRAVQAPHLRAARDRGPQHAHAGGGRHGRQLRRRGRLDRRVGTAVRRDGPDPAGLHQRADPLDRARDDPLVRLADVLDRRRLDAAGPRARGRRLGLRLLLPDHLRDLPARAARPGAVAAPERSGRQRPELAREPAPA